MSSWKPHPVPLSYTGLISSISSVCFCWNSSFRPQQRENKTSGYVPSAQSHFWAMILCVTVSACFCASSHSQCMTSHRSLWAQLTAPTKFNVFGSLKCVIVAAGRFNFCAREQPHAPRKSYCEGAKEQRLKTCKSSPLMASKLWHPSLSDSQRVKSCWKGGNREGMGSRFGFFWAQQHLMDQTKQQVEVGVSKEQKMSRTILVTSTATNHKPSVWINSLLL